MRHFTHLSHIESLHGQSDTKINVLNMLKASHSVRVVSHSSSNESLHGQSDSKCFKNDHSIRVVTHSSSNELNDSLGVSCVWLRCNVAHGLPC